MTQVPFLYFGLRRKHKFQPGKEVQESLLSGHPHCPDGTIPLASIGSPWLSVMHSSPICHSGPVE